MNHMPETVTCPECGDEVDPRGLSGHMETHDSNSVAVPSGDPGEVVSVPKEDVGLPEEEVEEAMPAASVTEDAITFRTTQEIEVTDGEMKQELLEELKEYIRGDTLRM